jgi:dethiobiotin synthetase
MINIDTMGYFITGSDTDAGKTYIACEIIRQLCDLNIDVEVRKPAESGCREDGGGNLIAADAMLLNQANGDKQTVTAIAPYRFRAALAPHRAARLEGVQLYLHNLIGACEQHQTGHRLIVEGAGGFYSPLAEDALNADLASALQLPVIIVVNDRIGAVNQALMTVAAVESRHLRIAAIILNQVSADHEQGMDNLTDLQQYCDYPLFRCMHRQPLERIFQKEPRDR